MKQCLIILFYWTKTGFNQMGTITKTRDQPDQFYLQTTKGGYLPKSNLRKPDRIIKED